YTNLAQTRRSEAERGIGRATAALREAIGIEPECCIRIVEDKLPVKDVNLCVDDVIQMALARRPEITLALTFSEVTLLTGKAKEIGRKLADNTRKGYTGNQKVKPEDVLTNEVLAAQAEAQHNEALWNLAISLADLERVTAGGFCANLLPAP